jgi:uncharacterized protein YbgA (DUF1722 family)/uncharacterized protein YbbK (DUF523 family)
MAEDMIRVGVSSCLLGRQVRFDGGHKLDGFLVHTFGRYVEWVPVCPEVELGLGTPRETLRLERRDGRIHLVMPKSGADHTEGMRRYAERRVAELAELELCGYVLKKDSPSCGMERVRVSDPHGVPAKSGRGLFAQVLLERLQNLPVEEEGRLNDPRLRENFVERVFTYRRLRRLFEGGFKIADLVGFHTAHKLLVMAHSPKAYAELGRLVAGARSMPREALRARYESELLGALEAIATPRRHANVLQHMLGYLSKRLESAERQEILELIEDHRLGLVPLLVPLTLIRHHARRLEASYLLGQLYLEPHPKELMLRNHV